MSAVHWVCPACGPHVAANEDGCCARCGADATAASCKGHACYTAIDSAVLAERERIVALIREWPNRLRNWASNPYMSSRESEEARFYAVQHEREVCRGLATLIEKETP